MINRNSRGTDPSNVHPYNGFINGSTPGKSASGHAFLIGEDDCRAMRVRTDELRLIMENLMSSARETVEKTRMIGHAL
jgi:hypothetical protein